MRADARKIRLSAVLTDDMTPIFYAIKNGAYQKPASTSKWSRGSGGSDGGRGLRHLRDGKASQSHRSRTCAAPLTVVANGAVYDPRSPITLVLVAADSAIKTAADCNGDRRGRGLNDISHLAILEWVDKNAATKDAAGGQIPGRRGQRCRAPHRPHRNEPQP